ncbi:hypothetical protein QL285_024022 [Trifolium repens]|nr:hypothetical protein QL285_024022 [Trifolium repens]
MKLKNESFTEEKKKRVFWDLGLKSIPGYFMTRPDSHGPTHLKSKSGPARRSCTENATLTAKKLKNDPKHGRSTAGRRKDVRSCDPTLQHASLTTLPAT